MSAVRETTTDERPLILSLALEHEVATKLNADRAAHFPTERNYLDAHLTLFHHLPAHRAEALIAFLEEIARETAPIPLTAEGWRSLGRGVALFFHAPALVALHAKIQKAFAAELRPQDLQKLRPHVTIQNKVEPAAARALLAEKQSRFAPFVTQGIGLELWRYDGGPWEEMKKFSFAGPRATV